MRAVLGNVDGDGGRTLVGAEIGGGRYRGLKCDALFVIFLAPQLVGLELGLYHRQQIGQRHRADVFGVHPDGLVVGPAFGVIGFVVEYRRGAMDAREREFSYQLIQRIDLLFLAGRPAHQRQEIAKCRRHKTGIAICRERNDLAVNALRQLLAARSEYQRQVRKFGRSNIERLVDQHLLVRVCQVVLPADDVRDTHLDVVANNCEVIERMPVGAKKHQVLGVGIVPILQTKHAVVE